ncbi:MAG: molybdopterin-dependent oxidoreductase [Desulfobacterales bacterium]|nr:molybdopterin-dependent oxidoreductase [Desulfobacterales bacterium]
MVKKREIPTLCRMCDHGCGILVSVEEGKPVHVRGNPAHPFNKGWICVKGKSALDLFYSPKRLKTPLIRQGGRLCEATWDDALNYISDRLRRLKEKWGPQALGIYYGEGVGHQEIRFYMKRFANVYGTPNFMSVGSICNASRNLGETLTFGGLTKPDVADSRFIIVWGANPLVSHEPVPPKIMRRLGKSNTRLIVIDPRKTETARRADIHLAIKPGTDETLILNMLHVILNEELWDQAFTRKWVNGFETLRTELTQPRFSPETGADITGIEPEQVRKVARSYAENRPACMFTGNGLEHHPFGVNTARLVAVLKAIMGNLDVPGGELFTPKPLIKDITTPMPPSTVPAVGADRFPVFCKARGEGHALCVSRAILDEKPYPIKGMTITGGNPTLQWPNSGRTREALKKLEFLLVIDVVESPDSRYADVVIPACTFLERDEHRINVYLNLPHVTLRRAVAAPVYGIPDQMIWVKLAHAMGYGEYFPWRNCKKGIDYLLSDLGVSYESLIAEGGIHEYDRRAYKKYEMEGFQTPSGKVEIFSERLKNMGYDPSPIRSNAEQSPAEAEEAFPLILTTGGNLLPYTHWQFRYVPRLMKMAPEPVLEIHPDTAGQFGISDSDMVEVQTETGKIQIKARLTDNIRRGTVHMAQGWESSNANMLTSTNDADPISGFPNLKSLRCQVRKL